MIDRIIRFSIYNKLIVGFMVAALASWGIYSLVHLPIDAVPDITDNQVQVITRTPDLSTQEVERFITYPLELELGNIPEVSQIRSISRFGLSVITVVFREHVDIYWARQQIHQRIQLARDIIPTEFGVPEMGPITTGLGEIYQYVVYPAPGYEAEYDAVELRNIQDWIIKRQLLGIPGVIEINSSGGFLKQFEVSIDHRVLQAFHLTMDDIYQAVHDNNQNTGASYIEKQEYTYFIRGEGMLESGDELKNILVKYTSTGPIYLRDVAEIRIGHAPRFGAVTMNGKGEVVAGQVMMLKGANSMEVTRLVKKRMEEIAHTLPDGVMIEPYLDRSKLINTTTHTVIKNLTEGALIVIFILVLFLGNLRAGLIVASVIPLSMLFAISMMRIFGVSANLMSLGAIDFGLIVDGAVIVVEAILHHLGVKNKERNLTQIQQEAEVYTAASKIRKSAAFGEIIILIVYVPILFLQGIEGKMFQPMAQTVSFAILGALLLSLTYVPMMSSLLLKDSVVPEHSIAQRLLKYLQGIYRPALQAAIRVKYLFLTVTVVLFIISLIILSRMGGEFIPTLEEGDFALHQILPGGSSIKKGVEVSEKLQKILLEFPEVEKVVTKIGTAEIPTDIMPIEAGDIYVILKPKSEWTSAATREGMFQKMETELNKFPGVIYEFTQPIQMRFNELMTGIRQDIAIKIYGEDLGILHNLGVQVENLLQNMKGVGDIQVEPTGGLQQMVVKYDRDRLASYGISIAQVSEVVKTAFAGKHVGVIYEGEKRFDIVVRLNPQDRQKIESLSELTVVTASGAFVPVSELASVTFEEGPAQISRDNTHRRITIGVNARDLDVATLIEGISSRLDEEIALPPNYYIRYGGQFENLQRATARLTFVVPLALALIFILLYVTFKSILQALLIFTAIPLSAIGGIWALYTRDMPFSISAGVGFIALFGVAVLNGIVLVSYFNQLKKEGMKNTDEIIFEGTRVRLRPVLLTALVASLGFLPMAISTSAGAEVQRPLATVVIGGLITATILTLFVVPLLYQIIEGGRRFKKSAPAMVILLLISLPEVGFSQDIWSLEKTVEAAKAFLSPHLIGDLKSRALYAGAEHAILPLPLQLQVGGEEIGDNQSGIQSLTVGKNFRTTNLRAKYRQYQHTQGELVKAEFVVNERLLERKIAEEYLYLAYLKSLLSTYDDQIIMYQEWVEISNRKQELGTEGSLTATQARLKLREVEIALRTTEQERELAMQSMRSVVNRDFETFAIDEADLAIEVYDLGSHPKSRILEFRNQVMELERGVIQANLKPTIATQLSLQAIDGDIPFFGYQIGVNVPLSANYGRVQLQSNQLNQEAIEAEKRLLTTQLSRKQKLSLDRISVLQAELEKIEDTLLEDAQTHLEQLRKAFLYDEISFSEVLLFQESIFNIRQSYYQKIYSLKMEVINANFLEID